MNINLATLRAWLWSVLVAAPVLPFFVNAHLSRGADRVMRRREDWLDLGESLPDSFAGLTDWVNPMSVNLPVTMNLQDGTVFSYWTVSVVFLGFATWFLVLKGFLKSGWRGVLLVIAIILAMGPFFRFGSDLVLIGEQPLPMLLKSLAYSCPHFQRQAYMPIVMQLEVLYAALIVGMSVRRPYGRW